MKVILTGASSGIGEAAAYALARSGAEIFLVARRLDRLEKAAQECRRLGAQRAAIGVYDLSVPGQGKDLVVAGRSELGGLDLLICNAGYGLYGPLQEITPEEMSRIWQVNLQSGFESIHAALPEMLQRRSGHIVIVSSVIGLFSIPLGSAYCSTKFAQAGLAEALWGELRGSGVDVTLICPSTTRSEFFDSSLLTPNASIFRPASGDSPESVAAAMLAAIEGKKKRVILSRSAKLLVGFHRLFPTSASRLVAHFVNRARSRDPS